MANAQRESKSDQGPQAQGDASTNASPESGSKASKVGFVSRLWTATLVLIVFAGAALVAFAFLLPDLDRHALPLGQAESGARRLGQTLTWVAFAVRTFDLLGGVILLLLTVLVLARRRWTASLMGLASAAVMLWPIPSRLLLTPEPPAFTADTPRLTVASINTLGDTASSAEFRAFLESADPDVVVLIEYDVRIDLREREWLKQRWPYFAAMPTDDRFGMAIYSRLKYVDRPVIAPPLQLATKAGELIRYPMIDPQIRAVVRVGDQDVVIQGAHPVPPMGSTLLTEQRAVHRALANWAASETRPRLIIGDLNATPRAQSSAWFTKAGLSESRDPSHIVDPRTWPSGLGVPLIMGVRIDRALASSELYCEQFTVGPAIGSDHRPIAVRYIMLPKN